MKELLLIAAGLILLGGVPSMPAWPWAKPEPPAPVVAPVPGRATAAVYVYEKDTTAIPTAVTVALNRLNRERQIVATLLEADTTDGDGDVPEQYRAALEAARKGTLPALVVLSGSTVLSAVPAPATADEIVRAVP